MIRRKTSFKMTVIASLYTVLLSSNCYVTTRLNLCDKLDNFYARDALLDRHGATAYIALATRRVVKTKYEHPFVRDRLVLMKWRHNSKNSNKSTRYKAHPRQPLFTAFILPHCTVSRNCFSSLFSLSVD